MSVNDEFIGRVQDYLVEFDGPTPLPDRVIDAIHAELPRTRQVKASPDDTRMPPMLSTISSRVPRGRAAVAMLGVTAVAVVAIGVAGLTILRPTSAGPAAGLGTFEPVPRSVVCGPATLVPSTLLGCSRDDTRLLIQEGDGNLFVLHADGSKTPVTKELSRLSSIPGSGRPQGATISADGSRVVFAGLTKEGIFCHNGALFAVDAEGGPAEVVWTSQAADDGGIVRYPTFSPDGTQIAFADGYCDWNHSVWVMNADGSDAHQILDIGPMVGAGYVRGLAWSPAGDRIALQYQGFDDGFRTYTFASDGSGFMQDGDASGFCWPGRRC